MKSATLACLVSSAFAFTQCGISLPKQGRYERAIFDGNLAPTGKWPWQVLLTADGRPGCGGSVISESWILTAYHCIDDIRTNSTEKLEAYSGITDSNLTKAENKTQPSTVVEIRVRERVSRWFMIHDIALLKLESPLVFDENVSPVCLPNGNQSIPTDAEAVVTGFGHTNNPELEGQLLEAVLPLVDHDDCQYRWASSGRHPNADFDMLVCAGWNGHGPNHGDSGGPLAMKATNGRWFQIGITSFGGYPDEQPLPHVFTDVRKYCDWIKDTTEGEASCQEEDVIMEVKIDL